MRGILGVMTGIGENPEIETKPIITERKRAISNSSVGSYRIEKKKAPKPKENQPEKSGEASVVEDGSSDRELLVVFYGNSKPCED